MWSSPKSNRRQASVEDFEIPEFKEQDLDDPSLLAELALLQEDDKETALEQQQQAPINQKKIHTPPKKNDDSKDVDVDAIIMASLDFTDIQKVEQEVVWSEQDLQDPQLLAELSKYDRDAAESNDNDMSTPPSQPDKPKSFIEELEPTLVITSTALPKIPDASEPTDTASLEIKLKSNNLDILNQYVQVEKMKALNKKRSGDKPGAFESLRIVKELQKRITNLEKSQQQESLPSKAAGTAEECIDMLSSQLQQIVLEKIDTSVFKARSLEFKRAALTYKKRNELDSARKMMIEAKNIQSMIDKMEAGDNTKYILPEPPVILEKSEQSKTASESKTYINEILPAKAPQSLENDNAGEIISASLSKSFEASKSSTDATESSESNPELVAHLLSTLDSQIDLCTKLSAQYFTSNEKDKALEFHKRKKAIISDRDTLRLLANSPSSSFPFRFNYSTIEYSIANSNMEVEVNEIHISIVRGIDFGVKGETDLESSVSFDLGWPSNESGTLAEGKGESRILQGVSPAFSLVKKITIERNKSFQRFLDRKKIVFEAHYHTKSFFGMMSRKEVIGRVSVKLDDLLTKCEIHQVVEIMDPFNPRKGTGCKIEILLRMRTPLLKADIVRQSSKWLNVTFGDTLIPPNPVEVKKIVHQRNNVSGVAASKPSPQQQQSSKPILQKSQISEDDILELEHAFLSPENIISNAVLEHEQGLIIKQISASHPPSEDMIQLKNAYDIKMNMLVTSIQLGALDMNTYIGQVKESINKTKSIAATFKGEGKLELAKQALVRVKLMQIEVDEVINNKPV